MLRQVLKKLTPLPMTMLTSCLKWQAVAADKVKSVGIKTGVHHGDTVATCLTFSYSS